MGCSKHLFLEQIAAVTILCHAGHSNKEIHNLTGVSLRSVQRWTRLFRESPDGDIPLQKKSTGRPRKSGPRTSRIIKRQLDINPQMTAPQLKSLNPAILSNFSLSTVRRRIHDDLDFSYRTALKKPLLTTRQIVYFLIGMTNMTQTGHRSYLLQG